MRQLALVEEGAMRQLALVEEVAPPASSSRRHECHARGCTTRVPPALLMCPRHWRMVPRDLQRRVWATYVEGQEIRKDPTHAYLDAAVAAINAVAALEARR